MPRSSRSKSSLLVSACTLVAALTLSTQAAAGEPAQPRVVLLQVTDSGQYVLAGKPVALANLRTKLRELNSSGRPIDFHIVGSPKVTYELVMPALQIAQEEGLIKVGFVMEPPAASSSSASHSSR